MWRGALPAAAAAMAAFPLCAARPLLLPMKQVKNVRDFGAAGDGKADDTAAVRAAIVAARAQRFSHPGRSIESLSTLILYFPAGTYLVSDTLQIYPDNTTCCPPTYPGSLHILVMGESVDSTTVRLKDGAPGFGDRRAPKPVWLTNPFPFYNDGQSQGYYDITVHTGDGNPGAVGIDHSSNNFGMSRDVRVVAGAGGGAVGFDYWRGLGGVTYFSRISVDGFDVGFNISGYLMTLPMEYCEVANGRVGVAVTQKGVQLRGLRTHNVTSAVTSAGTGPSVVVLDSALGGSGAAAIVSGGGQLYVRNVTSPGFAAAISDNGTTVADGGGEYVHAEALSLFPQAPKSASALAIEDPPDIPRDAAADWAVVDLDAQEDDTAAIQAAVDSGKTTVFLNGTGLGNITATIVLRGAIRRFDAGFQKLQCAQCTLTGKPIEVALRFEVEDHPVAVESMDAWSAGGIEHASRGTLVVSFSTFFPKGSAAGVAYRATAAGKTFFEGTQPAGTEGAAGQTPGPGVLISGGHRFWARALDIEGFRNHFTNDNSQVWVMGTKVGEAEGNPFFRSWGGATELVGGVFNGPERATATAVEVHDSDVTLVGWYGRRQSKGGTVVAEVSGAANASLVCCDPARLPARLSNDLGARVESGYHLPFYRSAYAAPVPTIPTPPPTPSPPRTPAPLHPMPAMPAACRAQAAKDCPGPPSQPNCTNCMRYHTGDLLGAGCPKGPKGISYNGVISQYCDNAPTLPPGPPPGPPAPGPRPPKPPGPPAPPGPSPPSPPRPPSPPLTPSCDAALDAACPGDQGQGGACRSCLKTKKQDPTLVAACPHKAAHNSTNGGIYYWVITEWCG